MDKYVVILIDGKRKRAVAIEEKSDDDARKHVEGFLLWNRWKKSELYKHDSYSPAMENSYLLLSSAVKNGSEVKWNDSNLKPI